MQHSYLAVPLTGHKNTNAGAIAIAIAIAVPIARPIAIATCHLLLAVAVAEGAEWRPSKLNDKSACNWQAYCEPFSPIDFVAISRGVVCVM